MPKTIPDSHANRLNYLKTLLAEIILNAPTLGFDAGKIATITALLQPLIDKYTALVAAEEAASQASALADQAFGLGKDELLALLDELRANPKCTADIATAMNLSPGSAAHDPSKTKPVLKAEAQTGHVRITGSKDYAELINIYMRLLGQTTWMLIGVSRKKFPFDDQTPLKDPKIPEVREYQGRGVINDEEVGEPSDIVTATFAG